MDFVTELYWVELKNVARIPDKCFGLQVLDRGRYELGYYEYNRDDKAWTKNGLVGESAPEYIARIPDFVAFS